MVFHLYMHLQRDQNTERLIHTYKHTIRRVYVFVDTYTHRIIFKHLNDLDKLLCSVFLLTLA